MKQPTVEYVALFLLYCGKIEIIVLLIMLEVTSNIQENSMESQCTIKIFLEIRALIEICTSSLTPKLL